MESLLFSTLSVASSEIGDKTQLLALLLTSRFRKPVPIIFGILVATLLNHAIAGKIGEWMGLYLKDTTLHIVLAVSFILAAIWVLIPDKLESDQQTTSYHTNVFLTTVIAFFLAEMGDKTQIVTALLAAQFQSFILVVLGSTIGMLIANVPVVLLGHKATQYISFNIIRFISSSLFFLFAVSELLKL